MLKNYFLVALRTFRRNKTFSLINILGLSIGISASLVIFLLVQYDFSFDKFEKEGSRIYRVVSYGKNDGGAWHNNCLAEPMGAAAKKVPTRQLPNWLLRLVAFRDPRIKLILPELGKVKNATSEKARRLLGWSPRPREEAIVATAESLLRLGLLKGAPKKAA